MNHGEKQKPVHGRALTFGSVSMKNLLIMSRLKFLLRSTVLRDLCFVLIYRYQYFINRRFITSGFDHLSIIAIFREMGSFTTKITSKNIPVH